VEEQIGNQVDGHLLKIFFSFSPHVILCADFSSGTKILFITDCKNYHLNDQF